MKFISLLLAGGCDYIIPDMNTLFHLFNLFVLVAVLYFLLFKPVKKFIAKRKETIIKMEEENRAAKAELNKIKSEYESILHEARTKAEAIIADSIKQGGMKQNEIISLARQEARDIIVKTENDINDDKKKAAKDIKEQIRVISAQLAQKILSEKITVEADDKIIDARLSEWLGQK